jgi:hypothetical protein
MFCPKCGTENPESGRFCRSCGTNLSNVPAALNHVQLPQTIVDPTAQYSRRELRNLRKIERHLNSNNPIELWGHGVNKLVGGVGFLVISIVLLATNIIGGHGWWWVFLFPAFSMIAAGISSLAKARHIESRSVAVTTAPDKPEINGLNSALPPSRTEYVKPQQSIYQTGDLVQSQTSVTEGTTRHLEVNKEGETVTLPRRD